MKSFCIPQFAILLVAGTVQSALPPEQAALVVPRPPLYAMPIALAWNPANDSSVSGYALYYGFTNQPATNRVDAGTNTTATILGLRAGLGYRIFAVSYNTAGLESGPSNELLLTPPAISRLQLARQTNGSMQVSGKAAPGTICTMQFTPVLQPPNWQTLAQTTADEVGKVIALDASASQVNSRFYRVALGALPLLGALQIQGLADGSMLLAGKAPPGASCEVQFAASPLDPTAWSRLQTVTADAEGNVATVDTTAREVTRRFYRMALP